jgi:hypothetical protein
VTVAVFKMGHLLGWQVRRNGRELRPELRVNRRRSQDGSNARTFLVRL